MIKEDYVSFVHKYVKITDLSDNLIVSGEVTSEKPNLDIPYISFDDKWFYGKTDKVKFIELDHVDTHILDEPPSFLTWAYWREQEKLLSSVDVYRDFSYDEIDPPIKPYIDELNNIDENIRTVTSCCGHGIYNWWVGIQFKNLESLRICLEVINTFNRQIALFSAPNTFQCKNTVTLNLTTCDIDYIDVECKLLDEFIKRLKKRINLYNMKI